MSEKSDARRLRRATLREKHLRLLDGDRAAAFVLDQMVAWQRVADDRPGDRWFYKSQRDLADTDLFGLYDPTTVGRKLNKLEERGYLRSSEPDDPTHARNWRVCITAINRDLAEFGASVEGYTDLGQPSDAVQSEPHAVQSAPHAVQSAPGGGAECTANAPSHNAPARQLNDTKRKDTRQNDESAHTRAKASKVDPEAPDDDTRADFEEDAERFDLDISDRPLLDRGERADMMRMQTELARIIGETWPMSKMIWRDRYRVIRAFWSIEQIQHCANATAKNANSNPWPYFRGCLNHSPPSDADDPTGYDGGDETITRATSNDLDKYERSKFDAYDPSAEE